MEERRGYAKHKSACYTALRGVRLGTVWHSTMNLVLPARCIDSMDEIEVGRTKCM